MNFDQLCQDSACPSVTVGSCTGVDYGALYGSYWRDVLLLSGDIETNPGPSSDTEAILHAINESNVAIKTDLGILKQNVTDIKSDLSEMKTELNTVKHKVVKVESNQKVLNCKISDLEQRMNSAEIERDNTRVDMSSISMHLDREYDRLEMIEQKLLMMESENVKCSLRIFGLQENENQNTNLEEVIESSVFNEMDENERLTAANISAKRVGNAKPKMVIAEFDKLENKLKLFKSRDALRKKGIRISSDLGYMQRQIIKRENDIGFRAYFKNGKLFRSRKEPPKQSGNTGRGVRTLDDRNREQLRGANLVDLTGSDQEQNENSADVANENWE